MGWVANGLGVGEKPVLIGLDFFGIVGVWLDLVVFGPSCLDQSANEFFAPHSSYVLPVQCLQWPSVCTRQSDCSFCMMAFSVSQSVRCRMAVRVLFVHSGRGEMLSLCASLLRFACEQVLE